MQRTLPPALAALDPRTLPTEDELPSEDGVPMETPRHRRQMNLLIETIERHWADRPDVYVGGDMFLYFSPDQLRGRDFRGPDFFLVLDIVPRERKSWVVWQEGRGPDLIIELLSPSTARTDKVEKKQIYQDILQVQEYYWYDPFTTEFAGFSLRNGLYQPLPPAAEGGLVSELTGLRLVRWDGLYAGIEARWLRWATPAAVLLPTEAEAAAAVAQQRDLLAQQRDALAQQRDEAHKRIAHLEALLARPNHENGEPA